MREIDIERRGKVCLVLRCCAFAKADEYISKKRRPHVLDLLEKRLRRGVNFGEKRVTFLPFKNGPGLARPARLQEAKPKPNERKQCPLALALVSASGVEDLIAKRLRQMLVNDVEVINRWNFRHTCSHWGFALLCHGGILKGTTVPAARKIDQRTVSKNSC